MTTITITAGHGGGKPGAEYWGATEAAQMAVLRDKVAAILQAAGYTVRTDGHGDENMALEAAVALISGSALAIELHLNAFPDPGATGVEVVGPPARKDAAQRIARGIAAVIGRRLRGEGGWIDQSKTARGTLAFVRAGGLIVEVCFMSNPAEWAAYQAKIDQIAEAIAAAVHAAVKPPG